MRLTFSILITIACQLSTYAQKSAIGTWRTHMPYQQAVEVLENESTLYGICNSGVFTFDLRDSSYQVITKIDGLKEVKIKTAGLDNATGTLLIAYESTNIDVIKGKEIINIDDILKKEISGIKSINSIDCINGVAYINCGFGTVLYDIAKDEIKDTYYLATNGAPLAVYNVAVLNNRIYAATDSGIMEADYNNQNLANYQNWTKHNKLQAYPTGRACTAMVSFNNTIVAYFADSIRALSAQKWVALTSVYPARATKLKVDNNKLLVIENPSVRTYDLNFNPINVYYTQGLRGTVASALFDNSGAMWVADLIDGLMRVEDYTVTGKYYPNGPYETYARRLAINGDKLIVASGAVGDNYTNKFVRNGIYRYENDQWKNINTFNSTLVDSFYDYTTVVIDPKSNLEYYGTFWKGIVEVNNGQFVKNYSYHNSTLGEALGNPGQYRVSGLSFDSKNQLWVANHWAEKPISVKRTNGQWQAFEFPGIFQELKYVSDITIDKYDQKWVCIPRSNSILIFKENANGTLNYKRISSGEGYGNLPKDATEVLSITEDKDGKIWAGTTKGLVVFYNPGSMLTSNNIDGQAVKVIDGEFVQSLLENESINCIKVDGANRKWIGTSNGAWLFSDDGTEQIHYFNTNNSPLLSNKINDIAINPKNGEVFFASDIGIVSYRSDATEGEEINKEVVKVFPNPVKDIYTGPIAIDGLVQNADVKITDINGKIVYHSKANGAQAIWYGNNFEGERVSTGVYLVFSTDIEGIEKMVNKILFIH